MKKNIYFLLIALISLALVIAIPFFLNNNLGDTFMAVYLISKILFGVLFLSSIAYCFLANTANGISLSLIVLNVITQFIPLVIRGLFRLENRQLLWSIIFLGVALIVYIAISGGIITMNKKMLKAETKYQGHEIEVVEDK